MTYDRAAIMKAAWNRIRKMKFKNHAMRMRWFARELKQAWFDAKMAVQRAQMSAADNIRETIRVIECKDRLTQSDWKKLDSLRGALAQTTEVAA